MYSYKNYYNYTSISLKIIFRDIEKATNKCVHLNGAIEYIYIYIFRLVPPKNIQLPIHVRMNEYAHI